MPSTTSQLQAIARELNKVQSAGQVKAAIGAALKAISPAYTALNQAWILNELRVRGTKELTNARLDLEAWYREVVSVPDRNDFRKTWQDKRRLVDRAYNAIANVEGMIEWEPTTSNLDILATSLREAPTVFLQAVATVAKETGKTAAIIAKEAGNVAGAAAGGIFSGLGLIPTVLVVGGVVAYLKGWNPMALVGKVTGVFK